MKQSVEIDSQPRIGKRIVGKSRQTCNENSKKYFTGDELKKDFEAFIKEKYKKNGWL